MPHPERGWMRHEASRQLFSLEENQFYETGYPNPAHYKSRKHCHHSRLSLTMMHIPELLGIEVIGRDLQDPAVPHAENLGQ